MIQEKESEISNGLPNIVGSAEANVVSFFDLPEWARQLQKSHWLPEKVVIADPLSYCAGVERANRAADQLLAENAGQTVFFYHAPIHSRSKVDEWVRKGAKIVNSVEEIPDYSATLLSAHGVGPTVWLQAEKKHLRGFDATCPLVDKTHREVKKFRDEGYKIILIGKKDHDEIAGTVDEAPESIIVVPPNISFEEMDKILGGLQDVDNLALSTQTTLSYLDLQGLIGHTVSRRPDIKLPNREDVCFATQNRQKAIIEAIKNAGADLAVVFGSDESKGVYRSNNSIELRETANTNGAKGFLVEDFSEIKAEWFAGFSRIGVSAGASAAPERVVEFLACLRQIGLKNDQISKVTVAKELQIFAPARRFDYSQAA